MDLLTDNHDQLPPTLNPLNLNPLYQLEHALGSGAAVWEKLKTCGRQDLPALLGLTFILEEHIESLIELYMLKGFLDQATCSILNGSKRFYHSPEYQPSQTKRGISLHQVLQTSRLPSERIPSQNYYESLSNLVLEDDTHSYSSPIMQNETSSTQSDRKLSSHTGKSPAPEGVAAVFPEDLGIAAVSIFMNNNQHNTLTDMEEDKEQQTISQDPPPSTTTIISTNIQPKKFRLNLIRHKNATPTELTTLQLFKAFLTMAKETDKTMIIHPVDSTKQHLTSLMSKKQIDSLTLNQLAPVFLVLV
jgi:hypothetical protein